MRGDPVEGDPRVPRLEDASLGAFPHRLAIRRDRLDRDVPCLSRPESAPARRHDEARGEPFQILFERGAQRLVEVVAVEGEGSLGRGEAAEIHEVTRPWVDEHDPDVGARLESDGPEGCPD